MIVIQPGKRFGRLVVLGRAGSASNGDTLWKCRCDCGTGKVVRASGLRFRTKSCGCLRRENLKRLATTHGMSGSRTYITWLSMRSRCNNPKSRFYYNYGGWGITVCERWDLFENFFEDMGEIPDGMTIERIDNDRGYAPFNCRWASFREQQNNTRTNRKVVYNDETLTIAGWSEKIGIAYSTLYTRLVRDGWSIERALTEPVQVK